MGVHSPTEAAAERVSDRLLSPEGYRAASAPVDEIELVDASLSIELLADPDRARFSFECRVASCRETAAGVWRYDIPAVRGEIANHAASDAHGNLQTELRSTDGGSTRLEVRLRRLVQHGETYPFRFEYEGPVRTVVTTGSFSQTVAYTGWSILSLPCHALAVTIRLPRRSVLLRAVPSADPHPSSSGAVSVHYSFARLRPLEAVQWLVAYRRLRFGAPFCFWTAAQVGAGSIGWFVARLLDGRGP